ncbi:MAG: urease subunit beta [Brachymonas sp.]
MSGGGVNPNAIGGITVGKGDIEINAGRPVTKLKVRNTGDRPVQIGSHYHFFEVNRAVEFDREKAFGKHLNIPAATAVRLEPGMEQEIELVPYAGKQCAYGFANLVDGWVGAEGQSPYNLELTKAMEKVALYGFKNKK